MTDHPAVKVLRRFIAEMNRWEWEIIREDFGDLENLPERKIEAEVARRRRRQRDRLARIFETYCEAGANARRVRDVMHAGGEEPDYNPDTEKILSVRDEGDKVIVETQMAHNFGFRLKYELVKVGGTWRVRDNRKCKAADTAKWSRWDL
jgi:hypothetical protein